MNHRSVKWICVTAVLISLIIVGCFHPEVAEMAVVGAVVIAFLVLA